MKRSIGPGARVHALLRLTLLAFLLVAPARFVTAQDGTPASGAVETDSEKTLLPPAAEPETNLEPGTDIDPLMDFDPDPPAKSGAEKIVVTGTRTAHSVEDAPVPTQVILRAEIEATATVNVADVLNQIPDLYVQQNVEFGLGASVVRMQGADPDKVAILLDGRRFRGGIEGIVDLRDIPVVQIEQIEIVRGPASSLYGSDAMAGVINIRTQGGSQEPDLTATAAGGSFGTQVHNAGFGYHVGPIGTYLSAQHSEVEIAALLGPISRQFEGELADEVQARNSAFVHLDYDDEDHEIDVEADFLRETNPTAVSQDLGTGGSWLWHFAERLDLNVNANRYGFDRENDLPGFQEDVTYANWDADARLIGGSYDLLGTEHLANLGIRFRYETFTAPATNIGTLMAPAIDASENQISPFVQDEILLTDELSLVAGISVDKHSSFGVEVNPRGTVTYRPIAELRVSFTVGRGYRAPDLLQLYDIDLNNVVEVGDRVTGYAILGNPNLAAETDLAFNLEADYEIAPAVTGRIGFFRHDFEDLIAVTIACPSPTMCNPGFTNPFPTLVGPIFAYANIGAATTQGFDVSVDVQPLEWLDDWDGDQTVDLSLGYGYLDTENQGGIPGEDGNELPFRPPNRLIPSLTWSHLVWGTQVRLWATYESAFFSDLANTPEGRVASHWFANFKWTQEIAPALRLVGWEAPGWLEPTSVFVQGLNVLDEIVEAAAIASSARQFAARASFLGGVRYQF